MAFVQNEIQVIGATRIAVGLSQVVRVLPSAFEYTHVLKIASGGGTLEIVPMQLSGSSTASGNAWGAGYPVGGSEIYSYAGNAAIYLAATGATMVAAITLGYTQGSTFL